MSHVASVQCSIKDLDALETALAKFDATLNRNKATFAFYGGAKAPCVHSITLNDDKNGHEVGLRRKSASAGEEDYELAYDVSFASKVNQRMGKELVGLRDEYTAIVAEDALQRGGYRVRREQEGEALVVYASRS